MRLLDPKVEDFLKGSDNLLDDYEFAETDHRTIEQETESLSKSWDKVKFDASSRESRFVLSTVYTWDFCRALVAVQIVCLS